MGRSNSWLKCLREGDAGFLLINQHDGTCSNHRIKHLIAMSDDAPPVGSRLQLIGQGKKGRRLRDRIGAEAVRQEVPCLFAKRSFC